MLIVVLDGRIFCHCAAHHICPGQAANPLGLRGDVVGRVRCCALIAPRGLDGTALGLASTTDADGPMFTDMFLHGHWDAGTENMIRNNTRTTALLMD